MFWVERLFTVRLLLKKKNLESVPGEKQPTNIKSNRRSVEVKIQFNNERKMLK